MKAIVLILVIAVCLITVACSSVDENNVSVESTSEFTADTTSTEETNLKPDLPDIDFEGAKFVILDRFVSEGHIHNMFEFYTETMNGDVLNDAIYMRNMTIEESYNIVIEEVSVGEPENVFQTAILAGDMPYSICVGRIERLSGYNTMELLYPLNDIPYIDLSMPWWNQNAQKGFSIGNKLFITSSDYLLFDKLRIYSIFFNKTMCADYSLGDLYDIVDSGKWTIDKLLTMSATVSEDLNGDGVMNFDDDKYGIVMGSYDCFYGFLYGMGNRISSKDADDMPTLTMFNDKIISSIDKLLPIMSDTNITAYGEIVTNNWATGVSPQYIFEQDRGLFYNEMLQISRLLDTDIDYGIIPLPKYDEMQEEYLTPMQYILGTGLCVAINVQDVEMTGVILEALSAESRYTTLSVFIETVIKTKKAPDERAPLMIDILLDGITYDIFGVYNWGGLQTIIANTIPRTGVNNLASEYAAKEESALLQMNKFIELFK